MSHAESPMEPLGSLSFSLLDGDEEQLKFYWAGSHFESPGVHVWVDSKSEHLNIIPVSKPIASFISRVRPPVVNLAVILKAALATYREDLEKEHADRGASLRRVRGKRRA